MFPQIHSEDVFSIWIRYRYLYCSRCYWVGLLKTNQLIFILFQCCGSGKFNPNSNLSIPDPGSRSASKNLSIFNPKNCCLALGNMIRDVHPESGSWVFTHRGSRIQGSKRHRIPNPGSGSATLLYFFPPSSLHITQGCKTFFEHVLFVYDLYNI